MKKIVVLCLSFLALIGCARTSNPENITGKIDMSKPVDYVIVKAEDKEESLYILTGEKSSETEPVEETEETSEESELPEEDIQEGDNE